MRVKYVSIIFCVKIDKCETLPVQMLYGKDAMKKSSVFEVNKGLKNDEKM